MEPRSSIRPPFRTVFLLGAVALLPMPAGADLTSDSFGLRGGHVSAGAGRHASESFVTTSALGQSEPVGPSGSALDLGTLVPGFPPILAGALPHLDLDLDGIAWFLDDDDDGDGLSDEVETNTGIFASPTDTGTDSLLADTDGDGVPDLFEVTAGSDPNDPLSIPEAPQLPALGTWTRSLVALLLGMVALSGLGAFGRRRT